MDTTTVDNPQPPPEPALAPIQVGGALAVIGPVVTHEEAPDKASYRSIVLAGTEVAQQIAPYDDDRVRMVIQVSGTGPVWIGTLPQCQAVTAGNTTGGGLILPTGTQLVLTHKQAVYLVPTNPAQTATVSILIEKRETT